MNRFDRFWKNERGVTLYELLAVLVISSIILGSMYGAFIMGINLYKKIGIESQMRDEADYIIANLLNDLNSMQPDVILFDEESQEIELYSIKELTYNTKDYISIHRDFSNINLTPPAVRFYLQERASIPSSPVKYDLYKIRNGTTPIVERVNDDAYFLTKKEDSPSILSFSCTSNEQVTTEGQLICETGIITTHFLLGHDSYSNESNRLYVEPKEFISEFGY